MNIRLWSFLLIMFALPAVAETWYIRPDGGSLYSAKAKTGQCDGKADAAYPGQGSNRHCAVNDVRYLWNDGTYGNYAWIIAGGDTVVIKGCASNPNQRHPDAPHCRIGWDSNTGPGAGQTWCAGSQPNFGCFNPSIPAGTAERHTRILGACALKGNCNSGNTTIRSNLTQLFGGYGLAAVLNVAGTRYVDIEGLEITSHNGQCVHYGIPAYPKGCTVFPNPNSDDYADQGIEFDNTSSNVVLQDLYIHGLTSSGILGPIGGPITLTRVFVGFNGFAGWNFDYGNKPNAPGSSIVASYVTMEGNGCNEEYPIVHAQFPAQSCYDSESGGFGDSWSGQDAKLDSFVCDHCVMDYNTKDGFIGPHTVINYLKIINSESYGNMGQQWKWGTSPGSTTIFENNLTVGNCRRMSAPLPGASQNYNSHLSLFCRAAGDVFSFYSAANSTVLFLNNTTVAYAATMFDLACQTPKGCSSTHYIFRNNIVLGALDPQYNAGDPKLPALFYFSDPSVKVEPDHSVFFNLRSQPCPHFGRSDLICADPAFANQPSLTITRQSQLDNFNFHPSHGSPAATHGQPIPGLDTDFFGTARPNPPSIGAVEP